MTSEFFRRKEKCLRALKTSNSHVRVIKSYRDSLARLPDLELLGPLVADTDRKHLSVGGTVCCTDVLQCWQCHRPFVKSSLCIHLERHHKEFVEFIRTLLGTGTRRAAEVLARLHKYQDKLQSLTDTFVQKYGVQRLMAQKPLACKFDNTAADGENDIAASVVEMLQSSRCSSQLQHAVQKLLSREEYHFLGPLLKENLVGVTCSSEPLVDIDVGTKCGGGSELGNRSGSFEDIPEREHPCSACASISVFKSCMVRILAEILQLECRGHGQICCCDRQVFEFLTPTYGAYVMKGKGSSGPPSGPEDIEGHFDLHSGDDTIDYYCPTCGDSGTPVASMVQEGKGCEGYRLKDRWQLRQTLRDHLRSACHQYCSGTLRGSEDEGDAAQHQQSSQGSHPNCTLCGAEFSSRTQLLHHEWGHLKLWFTCCVCHRHFPNPFQLKRHMKRSHLESKGLELPPDPKPLYVCDRCGRQFGATFMYLRHREEAHNLAPPFREDKPFMCSQCHKPFSDPHILMYHLKKQHSDVWHKKVWQ